MTMGDLTKAMQLVADYYEKHAIKQKGGKMYLQVVHRVEAFRRILGSEFGIDTQILVDDGHRVVVKATITNADNLTIGSGMAEEIRGQGHVNTTSALENAETSAIGRALASLGLSGGEYASANEMEAVPRKAAALNQAGSDAKVVPPADAPPPEPSQSAEQDPDDNYDKAFYLDMQSRLRQARHVSKVHQLFEEMKPKLSEIKARQPERAKKIWQLFLDAEDRLSKGDS